MRLQSLFAAFIAFYLALIGAACTGGGNPGSGGTGGGDGGRGCTQNELFTNGNFDAGSSGWTESSGKWPGLIVTAAAAGGNVTPQSGSYLARLGGYPEAAQDNLIATMYVPASATNLAFSFYSIVTSEDTSPDRHDSLFLSLDSDIQYVEEVLDNTDVHAQWQRHEKAIDPMAAGKTLVMLIRAENDGTKATTFLLDSLSLTETVCP